MATMNISLPEEMKAFIDAQLDREGYASASEYLRELVREAQRRQAKRDLDAKLLDGLRSPASEMTDADWSALKRRIIDRSPGLQDPG